jgi:hypothetical protein
VPRNRLGMIGGTAVVVIALPLFLAFGWPMESWAIAAGLWVANLVIELLLQRLPLGMGSLASAGVVAIGRMFRAAGLVTVLIVITVSDSSIGFPAAIVYGCAFTAEFGFSLLEYFGEASA